MSAVLRACMTTGLAGGCWLSTGVVFCVDVIDMCMCIAIVIVLMMCFPKLMLITGIDEASIDKGGQLAKLKSERRKGGYIV